MTNPNAPQYNDDDPLMRFSAQESAERFERDMLYFRAAKTIFANITADGDRCKGLFIPTDYIDAIEGKYEATNSARIYERFIEDPLQTAIIDDHSEASDWSNAYHHMGYFAGIDMAQRVLGRNHYDIYFSVASKELFEQIDNATATFDDFIDTVRDAGAEYMHRKAAFTTSEPVGMSDENASGFVSVLERLSQGLFLDQESAQAVDLRSGFGLAHIICNIAYKNKNDA